MPTVVTKTAARSAGLLRYYTGKSCVRGHVVERYVSGGDCVECRKEKSKNWYSDKTRAAAKARKWRAENVERHANARNKWLSKNRGKLRKQQSAWTRANKDKAKAIHRQWYDRNADAQRARGRLKRAENIEYYRAYSRIYNSKNKPKLAAIARNRLARTKFNGGTHTDADVAEILKLQKGRCAYCRTSASQKYHVDHIIPLAKGGSNARRNLQVLCPPCNQTKSARDPIEYMQEKGMLL